jgi:hypothetical protein
VVFFFFIAHSLKSCRRFSSTCPTRRPRAFSPSFPNLFASLTSHPHRSRISDLEDKLKALQKKQKGLSELERLKARTEQACAKLQSEISAIKQQKVSYPFLFLPSPFPLAAYNPAL